MLRRFLPVAIVLALGLVSGLGAYFGARALRPAPPPKPQEAAGTALAAINAGQFAVAIYRPRRIDTLVAQVSVSVPAPEAAAQQTALGLARLRDRTYQVLFDAAETPAFHAEKVTPETVAGTLAVALGSAVPGLKSVSVDYAVSTSAPRR